MTAKPQREKTVSTLLGVPEDVLLDAMAGEGRPGLYSAPRFPPEGAVVLTFPWGNEYFPFSRRAKSYLQYYQNLSGERADRILRRLTGETKHLTKAMYQWLE